MSIVGRKTTIVASAVAALWLALTPLAAYPLEAPPGCDLPKTTADGHSFYVDPVRGSLSNDGSKEHPWRTLAEVLDPANHLVSTLTYVSGSVAAGPRETKPINPKGPITSGDTIVLMSGDHGAVKVVQYVNSDFISVVAGSGQTPVVASMYLAASSHWLFKGIKFQGVQGIKWENGKGGPLVAVLSDNFRGRSDNIVLIENSFSTEDSTENWTPEDWVNRPYNQALYSTAVCLTIFNNHFFNLRDAMGIIGDHSLVQNNLIEEIGNDGIDIIASDVTVRGNKIRAGRHTSAEPLHADGIQGWTIYGRTNRNVVIDSNSIINLNPSDDNNLQGISIFDGQWEGLIVSNNLVINNAYHGISLWGVNNGLVINNTVIPARPDKYPSWLMIHAGKGKIPSRHVVVRNNIAKEFSVDAEDVTFDHNIAEHAAKVVDQIPGSTRSELEGHNSVDLTVFNRFVDFDLHAGKFDLRPAANSPAFEAGSDESAPATDIEGRRRVSPVDVGAFAR